jgi:hypothetical protein
MNFIEPKIGKVYDPAHLRPFDLDLAKQGHPCASQHGETIRLLRGSADIFYWDKWIEDSDFWAHQQGEIECVQGELECVLDTLRLAPLAVKDGKPLHVGDVIEVKVVMFGGDGWKGVAVTMDNWHRLNMCGRWPVEVKA